MKMLTAVKIKKQIFIVFVTFFIICTLNINYNLLYCRVIRSNFAIWIYLKV